MTTISRFNKPPSIGNRPIFSLVAEEEEMDVDVTPTEELRESFSKGDIEYNVSLIDSAITTINTVTPSQSEQPLVSSPMIKSPSANDFPEAPPEIIQLLKTLPFFSGTPESNSFVNEISKYMHMRKFGPGDIVIRHGEAAKAIFFVIRGVLKVISEDGEIEFAELSHGTLFGEIGIMFNVKRTATVVAKSQCTLLLLTSDDIQKHLQLYPSIYENLRNLGEKRFRELALEMRKAGKKIQNDISETFKPAGQESVMLPIPTLKAHLSSRRSSSFTSDIEAYVPTISETSMDLNPGETLSPSSGSPVTSISDKTRSPRPSATKNESALTTATLLAKRTNEPRRASVAVWSDETLLQMAQNIQNNQNTSRQNSSRTRVAASPLMTVASTGREDSFRLARLSEGTEHEGLLGLEEDVLAKCLSFLSIGDLMRIRQVCSLLKETAEEVSYCLLESVNLHEYNKTLTNENFETILRICGRQLQNLNLRNCWHLNNSGISWIGKLTPKIKRLNLASVWDVTDECLVQLARSCEYLEHIDLSNCRKITNESILAILDNCPYLTSIGLSYCKNLTDQIMGHAKWASLEKINFQRCTGIFDSGFARWTAAGSTSGTSSSAPSTCTQTQAPSMPFNPPAILFDSRFALKEIILSDCSFLSDSTITVISERCHRLERLSLSFCCSLTEGFASILVRGCPRITTLDLSFCGNAVTDTSVDMLSCGLKDLQRLNLRGCVQLTEGGIKSLANKAPSLREINISQCKYVTKDVIAAHGNPSWLLVTNQSFFEQQIESSAMQPGTNRISVTAPSSPVRIP